MAVLRQSPGEILEGFLDSLEVDAITGECWFRGTRLRRYDQESKKNYEDLQALMDFVSEAVQGFVCGDFPIHPAVDVRTRFLAREIEYKRKNTRNTGLIQKFCHAIYITVLQYLRHFCNTSACRLDGTTDNSTLGRLVNDDNVKPNSYMRSMMVNGKLHLCLFAVGDIGKGSEIRYNYGKGVSYPWRKKHWRKKGRQYTMYFDDCNNHITIIFQAFIMLMTCA